MERQTKEQTHERGYFEGVVLTEIAAMKEQSAAQHKLLMDSIKHGEKGLEDHMKFDDERFADVGDKIDELKDSFHKDIASLKDVIADHKTSIKVNEVKIIAITSTISIVTSTVLVYVLQILLSKI
jgi:hypothetical protein